MGKRRRPSATTAVRRVSAVAPDAPPIELQFFQPRDPQGWPLIESNTVIQSKAGNQYKIVAKKPLGQGLMSRVYHVEREQVKVRCALKVMRYKSTTTGPPKTPSKKPPQGAGGKQEEYVYDGPVSSEQDVKDCFEGQVQALLETRGAPNLVQYVEHSIDSVAGPYIVTRPVCQSNLEDYLSEVVRGLVPPMPYQRAVAFLRQVAQALAAMHKVSLVHADLSLRKVLVEREDSVRLCDLGLSLKTASAPTLLSGAATARVAPEIWDNRDLPTGQSAPPDHFKADSFALGVLMMTLLTLDFDLARPGQDEHISFALRDMAENEVREAIGNIYGGDAEFKVNSDEARVISALLRTNPKERMSVEEASSELTTIPQRRHMGQTSRILTQLAWGVLMLSLVVVGLLEKSDWDVAMWMVVTGMLAEVVLQVAAGKEGRKLEFRYKDKEYKLKLEPEHAVKVRRAHLCLATLTWFIVALSTLNKYELGPGEVAVAAITNVIFFLVMAVELLYLIPDPRAALCLKQFSSTTLAAWPSLQLAMSLGVLTRHPYWERASRAVGDRFHFTVYTASLVVTYFILGFWVCYIVFCLLRGLISCSRTLAKGGNPCEGCITFWRSMLRPAPVLPFTRLQGAELQASDAAPEPAVAKPQYEEKDDDFLSLPTPDFQRFMEVTARRNEQALAEGLAVEEVE